MIDLTTKRGQQQYLKVLQRIWMGLEKGMIRKLKPLLGRMYLDTAKLLEQGINDPVHAVDLQQFRLRKILKDQYKRTILLAHKETTKQLEAAEKRIKRAEMDQSFQSAMDAYIKRQTATNVKNINNTTKKAITKRIQKGIDAGKSYSGIAKDLRKVKGITTNYRASMIARTETHGAFNFATDETVRGTGRAFLKTWSFTYDSRTRRQHQIKQTRKMNEPFLVWGEYLMHPGQQRTGVSPYGGSAKNVIHCRCAVLYKRDRSQDLIKPIPIVKPILDLPIVKPKPKPKPVAKKPISTTDYDKGAKDFATYVHKLPDKEVQNAIVDYSGGSYESWNKYLRTGDKTWLGEETWTDESFNREIKSVNTLKSFFKDKKATRFEGTVFRGIDFDDKKEFKAFMKQVKTKKEFEAKGFVSSSYESGTALDFLEQGGGEHLVALEIKSKTGMPIRHLSQSPVEEEVLFNHGTKFKVKNIEFDEDEGVTWITVEEK